MRPIKRPQEPQVNANFHAMAGDVEYQAEVHPVQAEFDQADKIGRPIITLSTLRSEKRAAILRLANRHGARNVRVFGSVVHGENRPDSDVDFLVDLDPGRTLFDLGGLLTDLRELLGVEVDLVEAGCIHPYIKDRVVAEAVPL